MLFWFKNREKKRIEKELAELEASLSPSESPDLLERVLLLLNAMETLRLLEIRVAELGTRGEIVAKAICELQAKIKSEILGMEASFKNSYLTHYLKRFEKTEKGGDTALIGGR